MKLEITEYRPADGSDQPSQSEGKFVQLVLEDCEYLVFAPFSLHGYHNQIVAHFLDDRGISHRWRDPETLDVDTPSVRVIGGGRYRVDAAAQALHLWDNSQVYGRFDSRGLSDKIAASDHEWRGYAISVG